MGTVLANSYDVTGSQATVSAGNYQRAIGLAAGVDLLLGGGPVKVLLSFGVAGANH